GIPYIGSVSQWWRAGSPHDLSVPSPQSVSAGTRYAFASWSDAGAVDHAVSPSAPSTFDASFGRQFLLLVASVHGTPTGAGWYGESAVADFGVPAIVAGATGTRYAFTGWTGDSTASSPSSSVAMDSEKSVTASWRTEHLLTIISPYGTPTGAGWYSEGSVVTASVPDTVIVNGTSYRFKGWTGDSTETSSAVLVTMGGPRTLTATWDVVAGGPPSSPGVDVVPWIVL